MNVDQPWSNERKYFIEKRALGLLHFENTLIVCKRHYIKITWTEMGSNWLVHWLKYRLKALVCECMLFISSIRTFQFMYNTRKKINIENAVTMIIYDSLFQESIFPLLLDCCSRKVSWRFLLWIFVLSILIYCCCCRCRRRRRHPSQFFLHKN